MDGEYDLYLFNILVIELPHGEPKCKLLDFIVRSVRSILQGNMLSCIHNSMFWEGGLRSRALHRENKLTTSEGKGREVRVEKGRDSGTVVKLVDVNVDVPFFELMVVTGRCSSGQSQYNQFSYD